MRTESGALISANIRLRKQLEIAKEALKFYYAQKHFDTLNGKTRLLDNGGVAEEALQGIEEV